MPIYEYVCSSCRLRTEVVHGIHGHGPLACSHCGAEGTMTKAFAPPAIHFKGSGWAKKDRAATSSPGRTGASTSTTSKAGDSPKSDKAPAAGSSPDASSGSSSASTGPSPAGAAAD
jgi:putative FmdB family regulatory protein